jgi:methylmalonyl-CoA/ethylmalonyl-CoA epimerase
MEHIQDIPGFLFFDHVAIAVKQGELEQHVNAYRMLGFQELHREDVLGTDQVREVLLRVGDGPNLVQLLEPLSPESPVAKQIEKNGGRGGFAHVAFRVADIQKAFDYMNENGFRIIDAAPRDGSRGTKVFFVHPKTFGFLMEVVQEGESSRG